MRELWRTIGIFTMSGGISLVVMGIVDTVTWGGVSELSFTARFAAILFGTSSIISGLRLIFFLDKN